METRSPIKILMKIGTLSKIMEYTDKPFKLIHLLNILWRKTHDYFQYNKETIYKIHREVVAELFTAHIAKHDIGVCEKVYGLYWINLFSMLKPPEEFLKFMTDLLDIGLPELNTIAIYMSHFKIEHSEIVNILLSHYYASTLRNISFQSGTIMYLEKSLCKILPKVTKWIKLSYVKIDNESFDILIKNWYNTESLFFEHWDFENFKIDDIFDSEITSKYDCDREYKLSSLHFHQRNYHTLEPELKSNLLGGNKIKHIITLISKTKIKNSLTMIELLRIGFSKTFAQKVKDLTINLNLNCKVRLMGLTGIALDNYKAYNPNKTSK